MPSLKLALIHLNVQYQKPEENRKALLALITQSAQQGAQMIIAPEMSVSGYSFDNRESIEPFVEEINGPTLKAVCELTKTYSIYACIGLALLDRQNGIYTNSVVAIDPNGNVVCRYDKINAESRWACPGDPKKDNTFETPWGRMGLLICSDTYNGLMPRVTALRGADMLIVPANWPPMGLNPVELWRTRAIENGLYLAACNRTGVDRTMDCKQAATCVCTPEGKLLRNESSEGSQLLMVNLPLTPHGRLESDARRLRLADRRRHYYHDCYLNLRAIGDLTRFLNLPKPGVLNLNCIVPHPNDHPIDALLNRLMDHDRREHTLYLLPVFEYSDSALDRIARIIHQKNIGVITRGTDGTTAHRCTFQTGKMTRHWHLPHWPFSNGMRIPQIDFGPARLHIVPFGSLMHPEMAVASAKQGCDLLVSSEERLTPRHCLMAGARTIEKVCVAVCAVNEAGIWISPKGHSRWEEHITGPGGENSYTLDTRWTREKKFQDRIDFEVLLR